MKPPVQASKISALLSGVVLGVGMPTINGLGQTFGLSQSAQSMVFVFGLVFLFFGPVLLLVVGTEHLSIKSGAMLKRTYWASLRQVAVRSVVWLVGGGLGFALLAVAQSLSS